MSWEMKDKILKYGLTLAVLMTSAAASAVEWLTLPPAGERSTVSVEAATNTVIEFAVPIADIQQVWAPSMQLPFTERKWRMTFDSNAMKDFPFVSFFNLNERNRFSVGVDALERDCRIASKINQEKGVYEVRIEMSAAADGNGTAAGVRDARTYRVTIDRREVEWTEALGDWRDSLGYAKVGYPEGAWKPAYCSWYAAHAAISQDWVERTAKIAAGLGFKTFILDDGWSYDEAKRVNPETIKSWYRDTGEWNRFSAAKFPDFKAHRERMRELGLNYIVWVAPYFLGTRSPAFKRWGYDVNPYKPPFEGNSLVDIRNGAMMASVTAQLVELVKNSDLDGLKIDFLDEIPTSVEKPLGTAMLGYTKSLMKELRAVKPEGLFEFRQSYATPLTAALGTQFRAGDVPFEWHANLLRIAQIRLAMGDGVPIHSDPIYWSEYETEENIDRHFKAAMAGVPMLSMDLEQMSARHRERVRYWLDFYKTKVERFQRRGHWRVRYNKGSLAYVTSELDGELLAIVNDKVIFDHDMQAKGLKPTVELDL